MNFYDGYSHVVRYNSVQCSIAMHKIFFYGIRMGKHLPVTSRSNCVHTIFIAEMVLGGCFIGVYQQWIILYKRWLATISMWYVWAFMYRISRVYQLLHGLIRLSFFNLSQSSNNNINKNCDWKSIESKCCRLRFT